MAHRQTRLIFIVTGIFLLWGAIIVLWSGSPKLPGHLWQVQETDPRFFVTRHLARMSTWPALQHTSSWSIYRTDPQVSGSQTSMQTGMLALSTATYLLPGKWSDTSWVAEIGDLNWFSTSGSVLVRGSYGYVQFAESSAPKSPYPLQESPQQAIHLLIDALQLRWAHLPPAATHLIDTSPHKMIVDITTLTKKTRIVADEQKNRLYLFSWDQFVYSWIASPQSGTMRRWTTSDGQTTWTLQQEPKAHQASLIYQQSFPIAPTIDATISRREKRTSLHYMIAGTLSFPKGFVASFTGTRTLERAPVQPLHDLPKHAIPRAHWEEIAQRGKN